VFKATYTTKLNSAELNSIQLNSTQVNGPFMTS